MPLQLPSRDPQPLPAGLYTTDAFHRRPLLVVDGDVVRSWNEAHALHGPARLSDVNPAYVAALISGNHNAVTAPYSRIRRLPRAHHVCVRRDGMVDSHAYDPLAGGAAAMEAEALHQYLRQGLLDHVQKVLAKHDSAIGCEHSSGLDSNAVLGALVHGVGVEPARIHTWSQEGGGEGIPMRDFRPFHRLKPTQCHRFEPGDETDERIRNDLQKQLDVYGAPPQMGSNQHAIVKMQQLGCTLLFSGFGGDQAISHNASNVPTDLVAQGRWQELKQWMGGRRATLKTAAKRVLALKFRAWAVNKVLIRSRAFCTSDLLQRTLTPKGQQWLGQHLKSQYPWEIDNFLLQHQSIRQRVMADWVALRLEDESRMASFHGIVKAFPLLDERLIAALLQQDPTLFGEKAGQGRLLHRRAFAPFLPPYLRDNPSKKREPEGGHEQWESELIQKQQQRLSKNLAAMHSWHPALKNYWYVDAIQRESENVLSNQKPSMKEIMGTSRAMETMTAISGWWHALSN